MLKARVRAMVKEGVEGVTGIMEQVIMFKVAYCITINTLVVVIINITIIMGCCSWVEYLPIISRVLVD